MFIDFNQQAIRHSTGRMIEIVDNDWVVRAHLYQGHLQCHCSPPTGQ
jgi:hypothetical protein